MGRPFPEHPWGRSPYWRKAKRRGPLVLEVPLGSPQRALHARRVVIKPHDWTREAIRHRLDVNDRADAEQVWRDEWIEVLRESATETAARLGLNIEIDSEPEGAAAAGDADVATDARAEAESTEPMRSPQHICARVRFAQDTPQALARAVALACSARLPRTWFCMGRLALLGGKFWRRERGYRLHLRPVRDVHLPREVRAKIRDLLNANSSGGN